MKLLTVEESAERLGVGVRFVRRIVAEKRIEYTKIGKHVRIADVVLDAFIAEGRVEPFGKGSELTTGSGGDHRLRTEKPRPDDEVGDWTAEAS